MKLNGEFFSITALVVARPSAATAPATVNFHNQSGFELDLSN